MPEVLNAPRSYTTPKQLGGVTGKGFVKGDPRINRKGRPKNFDQTRSLAKRIAHEQLPGSGLTVIEAIFRTWAKSKEPRLQEAFVQYAFGKVPDKVEGTGLENKSVLVLHFTKDNEQASNNANGQRLPASVSRGTI